MGILAFRKPRATYNTFHNDGCTISIFDKHAADSSTDDDLLNQASKPSIFFDKTWFVVGVMPSPCNTND